MSQEAKPDSVEEETPDQGILSDDTPGDQELATLQKRFADTQRKLTELATANAELRGKISVLGDKPREQEVDPLDQITADEILQDPTVAIKALKSLKQDLLGQLAEVLRARDAHFAGELKKLDPERLALREQIEELKQDPDLADLDESVLVKIAKRSKRQAGGDERRPFSAPGGRSSGSGGQKDVRKSDLFRMVYGNEFDEGGKK
jgi:hypothetical protein